MSEDASVRTDEQITINETAKALAEDLGIDNPLMISDQGPAPALGDEGIVKSVNISPKKGMRKAPAKEGVITLVADYGVAEDAHAGDWHRQVSFLAEESIDVAREHGLDVWYGDFAENITLYRPFAQINVGASADDIATAQANAISVGADLKTAFTIKGVKNSLDLLTGKRFFGKVFKKTCDRRFSGSRRSGQHNKEARSFFRMERSQMT